MWHRKMERECPAINGGNSKRNVYILSPPLLVGVACVFAVVVAPSMTTDQKDGKTTAMAAYKSTTKNEPKRSTQTHSENLTRDFLQIHNFIYGGALDERE